MDLNLLRVFAAVYETRSVTEAANQLGMSQPGLSTALNRLRDSLGDMLFVRAARGVEPTPKARALFPAVQEALRIVEEDVIRGGQFDAATTTGPFTVAMSDVGETVFLPVTLAVLTERAPRAWLRSVSFPPPQLITAMQEGSVDLAVGYFPDLPTRMFHQRRVAAHSFSCVVRDAHPAGDSLSLEEFERLPHLVVEPEGRSHEIVDAFLAREGIRRHVAVRTPHFLSIPLIITETDLIVTVPDNLADALIARGGLRAVKPPFEMPISEAHIYWHRSVHRDARNRWLREALVQAYRERVPRADHD